MPLKRGEKEEKKKRKKNTEAFNQELTSSCSPLNLFTDQRGRQVNCEGERGLLGVLYDDASFTDLLGHHILVFCDQLKEREQDNQYSLKKKKKKKKRLDTGFFNLSSHEGGHV